MARFLRKTSVSFYVQYFGMKQLLPQQVRPSFSGDQADCDETHYSARVTNRDNIASNNPT